MGYKSSSDGQAMPILGILQMVGNYMIPLELILGYGEYGVSWMQYPGALGNPCRDNFYQRNPLMFTCSYCRKTLGDGNEQHEKGCRVHLQQMLGI